MTKPILKSEDCGHFFLTSEGAIPFGQTHRHEFVREICPTCGLYFLNCSVCHPSPRCPDCFDKPRLRRHPLADLTEYSAPGPQDDLPTPINYRVMDGHDWRPVLTFHVEPPPPERATFAISEDGYLLSIDEQGRAHHCQGQFTVNIE